MKTLLMFLLSAVLLFIPAASQAQAVAPVVTLTLSNNTPVVGETVVITLNITNVDSVAHNYGAQVGYTPQVSSFSCHPGTTFFNGLQKATYQPGESHTYQTTFIAPAPSCVPNNDWLIYSRAQDLDQTGTPIVGTSFQDLLVQ